MTEISIIQYEVRYKPLWNFSPEVPAMATRYFKLFDKLNYTKQDSPNEQIELTSIADGYQILISRGAATLRFDEALSNALDKNFTPVKTFFKIIADLESLNAYSEADNHMIFHFHAVLLDKSTDENVSSFYDKFGTEKTRSLMKDATDASLLVERRTETIFHQIMIGPYIGIGDLADRNVQPLNPGIRATLQNGKGNFYDIRTLEKYKEASFEDYQKLAKTSINLLKSARYE